MYVLIKSPALPLSGFIQSFVSSYVVVYVMAKRLVRKVARLGKYAAQFRFTSTLEYIDVSCYGNW